MAKLEITSTTTVREFADEFKKEFGATLRVYNGRSEADSDAILVSLGAKTGIVECRANRTVGSFVKMMQNDFNLKVKVRTSDDWVTVIDGLTLNRINDLPKNPTKTQMEDYVSYQKKDIEEIDKNSKQSKEESEKDDLNNNLDNKFESVQEGYIASQELAKSLDGLNYALHRKDDSFYNKDKELRMWGVSDIYIAISNGRLLSIASNLEKLDSNLRKKGVEENNCDFYFTNIKGEYINNLTQRLIYLDDAPWTKLQDDTIESIIDSFNGNKDIYPPIPVRFIYNGEDTSDFPPFKFQLTSNGEVFYEGELG